MDRPCWSTGWWHPLQLEQSKAVRERCKGITSSGVDCTALPRFPSLAGYCTSADSG